ncbi:hypothetical protein [Uliginosibacterium sp. 31-12]|uniref:hypothetical protein n=1 Tax=Uliginosibacterium sp. 31-12 TaxID=3062781 RepID=UPI0026E4383A|nr:hypothetical protein [Uliginosibacterium sp. 31-12]MDO6385561.1 hypothetical protein [Uliginosibacterium sp. 31-12]
MIILYSFRYPDPIKPGRLVKSRYKATRDDILSRHPGAIIDEESAEMREAPDDHAKLQASHLMARRGQE